MGHAAGGGYGLGEVETLLTVDTLPFEGAGHHFATYWVTVAETGLIGAVGVERYGPAALLRSVAVRPPHQARGIGRSLVEVATSAAAGLGMNTLHLLTTTAVPHFEKLGYVVVDRNQVPVELRTSAEFSGVCPDSATCMRRSIA